MWGTTDESHLLMCITSEATQCESHILAVPNILKPVFPKPPRVPSFMSFKHTLWVFNKLLVDCGSSQDEILCHHSQRILADDFNSMVPLRPF